MKVALCFIISGEQILNKEEIWKKWIEPNKDIINVYFYYKDFNKITSQWIREHSIPPNFIYETSYYHVIPAYVSVMRFALIHDINNSWFCMLTESCCPIISPTKFRYLFYQNYNKSIMNWKESWWNIQFHKRANLQRLPKEYHLANDPWFILKRENVSHVLDFVNKQKIMTKTICDGGLANESLFAIILYYCKQLEIKGPVIRAVTHITDWTRMTSATSPHLFKEANDKDIQFIDSELKKNKYAMFIRKVSPDFPDEILSHYIYEENKDIDDKLIIKMPYIFMYNRFIVYFNQIKIYFLISGLFVMFLYFCNF